ncbi:hypothetical protein U1Q18_008877 [Sarracenia purpurea var. burkii]
MRDSLSLSNFPLSVRNSNRVRDGGREKTIERDRRNTKVKEKSKGIFEGFTAGARCGVDGETRFGGQHYSKDPVLEIAGAERRCVREHWDANIDGQGRIDGRAQSSVCEGSILENADRGLGVACKSSEKGGTHENFGQDAGAVFTIQELRELVESPEDLKQGSNLGDIGIAYTKDNLENTDIEDIPAMPTSHRKGKPCYVSFNKPLVGLKAKKKNLRKL